MRNRMLALLMALLLLCAMPIPAHATEFPDPERPGSITLTMTYQEEPVSGGTLTIYRVADVVCIDGDYSFAYTADFAEATIPVTELDSAELPGELADIAREQDLSGITRTVGEDGTVSFTELQIGLYLVVQEKAAPGFKRVNPFLVSVPYNQDGTYIYDVDTAPKNLPGPETEPTEPSTEPTTPPGPVKPNLPQTGQTNWPIPVLAVSGVLLTLLGIAFCISERKKSHEA